MWLILMGVIWSAAAHPRATFADKRFIGVRSANQKPLENLVPLIIEGVGEKHGNLYIQNQRTLLIESPLFGVKQ